MAPYPTGSTVWLACARECRGYLWGGLRNRGSTLVGGTGDGLGGKHGGSVGGTLGSDWGSALRCSWGSCIVSQVCLRGGVGVGVGDPVAEKNSASCWISFMVWATKRAKCAASVVFERESARRLDASVAALAEYIVAMEPLWGGNCTFLEVCSPHVSGM